MRNVYRVSVLVFATAGILIRAAIPREAPTAPGKSAAGATNVASPELFRFARLITAYEMELLHRKKLAPSFRPDPPEKHRPNAPIMEEDEVEVRSVDLMSKIILDEAGIGASWKVRWIRKEGPEATEFEKRAGKKLDQGIREVGERSSPDTLLYVRSLDATEGCLAMCHAPPPESGAKRHSPPPDSGAKRPKAGDSLGRISLEITFRTKEGGAKNMK